MSDAQTDYTIRVPGDNPLYRIIMGIVVVIATLIVVILLAFLVFGKRILPQAANQAINTASPVQFIKTLADNSAVTSWSLIATGKITNISGNTITILNKQTPLTFTTDQSTLLAINPLITGDARTAQPPKLAPFDVKQLNVSDVIQVRFMVFNNKVVIPIVTLLLPGSIPPATFQTSTNLRLAKPAIKATLTPTQQNSTK